MLTNDHLSTSKHQEASGQPSRSSRAIVKKQLDHHQEEGRPSSRRGSVPQMQRASSLFIVRASRMIIDGWPQNEKPLFRSIMAGYFQIRVGYCPIMLGYCLIRDAYFMTDDSFLSWTVTSDKWQSDNKGFSIIEETVEWSYYYDTNIIHYIINLPFPIVC